MRDGVRLLELAHVDGDEVCSPPYNASASASAVSVLPTPEGPTSMNTPSGLLRVFEAGARGAERAGRSSPARASWPMTRSPSVSASVEHRRRSRPSPSGRRECRSSPRPPDATAVASTPGRTAARRLALRASSALQALQIGVKAARLVFRLVGELAVRSSLARGCERSSRLRFDERASRGPRLVSRAPRARVVVVRFNCFALLTRSRARSYRCRWLPRAR